ncbi:MAG: pyrroloquinoline quinone biosynthesis peptide chaperone PqqD [Alphaproteobacteria bacterium]|jgi:pyrroloquinoline quinone biosynthesis protein D|nr:pyrroloquinoline quinone biosynthesis peptide chaperone PqqD [Alphaproteobacteria bacterium]
MSENIDFGLEDCFEFNPMYLFRWEESQQSHILLYPEGVIKLNETAGQILKLCTGEVSVGEMIQELKGQYANDDVENGVVQFLAVSSAKGWISKRKP